MGILSLLRMHICNAKIMKYHSHRKVVDSFIIGPNNKHTLIGLLLYLHVKEKISYDKRFLSNASFSNYKFFDKSGFAFYFDISFHNVLTNYLCCMSLLINHTRLKFR